MVYQSFASILLLSALLAACSTPAKRLDSYADTLGLQRAIVTGQLFQHIVYFNTHFIDLHTSERAIHVYIDGDGTPFLRPHLVASDPTPRKHLLLDLMKMDTSPSIYLGRPCYHGLAKTPPCSARYWTVSRYSQTVIDSMATSLSNLLRRYQLTKNPIVFIGYSGGGTLAMLLAEQFPSTVALITVAGNLDPDRWTAWHGYSPLRDSLNPATRPPLPNSIRQYHFSGAADINIPTELVNDVMKRQSNAKLIVIDNYNHSCCWQAIWADVLANLKRKPTKS